MDQRQFQTWIEEWEAVWQLPALNSAVSIAPNKRLRRSLGRCHPTTGRISLHPSILEEREEILKEVLCHEVAHVAAYLLHGPTIRPHGREWAILMEKAGFVPRARMEPSRLSEAAKKMMVPQVFYRHHCPECDAARLALRPIRRWRCGACRDEGREGALDITTASPHDVAQLRRTEKT